MQATLISSNTKRKTAQLVITHGEGRRKRSETRHCRANGNGWKGRIWGRHAEQLAKLEATSAQLARKVDALNREMKKQAQTATAYTANMFFVYAEGDNREQYGKHIVNERRRARGINAELRVQVAELEPLAEVRREELAKRGHDDAPTA